MAAPYADLWMSSTGTGVGSASNIFWLVTLAGRLGLAPLTAATARTGTLQFVCYA